VSNRRRAIGWGRLRAVSRPGAPVRRGLRLRERLAQAAGEAHFSPRGGCETAVFGETAALYARELDLSEVQRAVESQG
jgi:hypothetical protein